MADVLGSDHGVVLALLEQHQFLLEFCLALHRVLLGLSAGRGRAPLFYLGFAAVLALLLLLGVFPKDLHVELTLLFVCLLEFLELLLQTARTYRRRLFLLVCEFKTILLGDDDRAGEIEVLLGGMWLFFFGEVESVGLETVVDLDALDVALPRIRKRLTSCRY